MNRCCSFCFKSKEAKILIGGTGVFICDACVKSSQNIIDNFDKKIKGSNLPAYEAQSTELLLEHLPKAEQVSKQAYETLYATVNILRKRKVSWQKVGDALGISRQAAWERFSD